VGFAALFVQPAQVMIRPGVARVEAAGPAIGVNGRLRLLERPIDIAQAAPGQGTVVVTLMAGGGLLVVTQGDRIFAARLEDCAEMVISPGIGRVQLDGTAVS